MIGDYKDMIIPVRQFSITGMELKGFRPEKEYPVLAIDIDEYIPEAPEEGEVSDSESETESVAFFLVGNDSGEFTWVSESDCRLYPLAKS